MRSAAEMSGSPNMILVADGDPPLRRVLRLTLGAHGYAVREAGSASEAMSSLRLTPPALVLLDLALPELKGRDPLSCLRETTAVPIIALTSHFGLGERQEAFERGADDCLAKPFSMKELMARLQAALHRQRAAGGEAPVHGATAAGLMVDAGARRVLCAGHEVKLTAREFETLLLLLRHPGRVLTPEEILREIWGPDHVHETHFLRVHIGRLRRKLEPDPGRPRYILTEPAIGYRFRGPEHGAM